MAQQILGTDVQLGSVITVSGIPQIVTKIQGNTITSVPVPGPVPTTAVTATSGNVKAVNGLDNVPNVQYSDGTIQTTAFGSTPALTSVKLNGATSGSNTIAAPAIAGTGTTTTLPSQSVTLAGEVVSVDLTAQSAAITTTTLFAVVAAGQYRVVWDAKVTTVDATSSTLGALTIVYTDPDGVVITITAAALIAAGTLATTSTLNTTSAVLLGLPLTLNCKAGTNITYAMAYASNVPGTMNYNLHIKVEAL